MFRHSMAAVLLIKQVVIIFKMCHIFRTFVEILYETSVICTIIFVLGWLNYA